MVNSEPLGKDLRGLLIRPMLLLTYWVSSSRCWSKVRFCI